MSGQPVNRQSRSQILDVLRGIAIILVLCRHVFIISPLMKDLPPWAEALRRGGWSGVDLFFVLSGFLISGILFKEYADHGSISLRRFFVRRGFKIYPSYFIMLLFTALLVFSRPLASTIKDIPGALWPWFVFAQNYINTQMDIVWGHTWSLAVEEQFYVFLPLLLVLLARVSKNKNEPFRSIPVLFLAIAAACFFARLFGTIVFPELGFEAYFKPFHLRIDSLFCGVLLGYLHQYHPRAFDRVASRFRPYLLILGAILLAPAFLFEVKKTPFLLTGGFTFLYTGSALILASVIDCPASKNRPARFLAFIGAHSYSIYLWHQPIAIAFRAASFAADSNPWAVLFAYFAVSIAFGIAVSRLVEMPLLKVRDRLYPSRSEFQVI